jgi:hypothetical protein
MSIEDMHDYAEKLYDLMARHGNSDDIMIATSNLAIHLVNVVSSFEQRITDLERKSTSD